MTRLSERQARAMGLDVPKASKYHSRKVILDGHKFDSQKEASRYAELKLLLRGGEITDLELQPGFILQEGYRTKDGVKILPIIYRADFRYKTKGGTVVEDVKSEGTKTQVYRLKKKLLLAKWPELDFREV